MRIELNNPIFADELLERRAVFVRSLGKWNIHVMGYGWVAQALTLDAAIRSAKARIRYLDGIKRHGCRILPFPATTESRKEAQQ
jgi:hypothetical protein